MVKIACCDYQFQNSLRFYNKSTKIFKVKLLKLNNPAICLHKYDNQKQSSWLPAFINSHVIHFHLCSVDGIGNFSGPGNDGQT